MNALSRMSSAPALTGTYACAACGELLDGADTATLWMNTPYGLSTLRSCRTQECARAASVSRPGWKLRKGNRPPGEPEKDSSPEALASD